MHFAHNFTWNHLADYPFTPGTRNSSRKGAFALHTEGRPGLLPVQPLIQYVLSRASFRFHDQILNLYSFSLTSGVSRPFRLLATRFIANQGSVSQFVMPGAMQRRS
jgi:hypothetical protein